MTLFWIPRMVWWVRHGIPAGIFYEGMQHGEYCVFLWSCISNTNHDMLSAELLTERSSVVHNAFRLPVYIRLRTLSEMAIGGTALLHGRRAAI